MSQSIEFKPITHSENLASEAIAYSYFTDDEIMDADTIHWMLLDQEWEDHKAEFAKLKACCAYNFGTKLGARMIKLSPRFTFVPEKLVDLFGPKLYIQFRSHGAAILDGVYYDSINYAKSSIALVQFVAIFEPMWAINTQLLPATQYAKMGSKEYRLLRLLSDAYPHIVTKDTCIETIYDEYDNEYLANVIHGLRLKLKPHDWGVFSVGNGQYYMLYNLKDLPNT